MPFIDFLAGLSRNPIAAVVLPVALGSGSGLITRSAMPWYQSLQQPAGTPPRWAFPVAWTSLYAAMGFASHIIVKALDRSPSAVRPLYVHVVTYAGRQIPRQHSTEASLGILVRLATAACAESRSALNMLWTPLFFGLRKPELALADILALLGTVATLLPHAYKVDGLCGALYTPYLGWLSYATYLNVGIIRNNRDNGYRGKSTRKEL